MFDIYVMHSYKMRPPQDKNEHHDREGPGEYRHNERADMQDALTNFLLHFVYLLTKFIRPTEP